MITTDTATRSYSSTISKLLRDYPNHDTPPADRDAWIARKVDLLVAVEAAEGTRMVRFTGWGLRRDLTHPYFHEVYDNPALILLGVIT